MWSGNLWPEAKMSVLVDIAMSEAASQGVAAGRAHAITASVLTSLALRLRVASKRARKTAARLRNRDLVQVGDVGLFSTLMGFTARTSVGAKLCKNHAQGTGLTSYRKAFRHRHLNWGI